MPLGTLGLKKGTWAKAREEMISSNQGFKPVVADNVSVTDFSP